MQILLTVLSFLALVGSALAGWRSQRHADSAWLSRQRSEELALKLQGERARVTVLERQSDSLLRELRSLSSKFYAAQRELGEDDAEKRIADAHVQTITAPYCSNYEIAQREGPTSKAAQCGCDYCGGRRAAKEAFRRGQARAGHLDPGWVKAHAGGQVDVEEN